MSETRPARGNPLIWRFHFPKRGRIANHTAIVSYLISGACLEPWLRDGDAVSFNTSVEPRHGDLVVVAMKYRASRQGFCGATPGVITRRSVKLLQIDDDGQGWLVCNTGRVELDCHTIIGVAIATHWPPLWSLRRWRYPMARLAFPLLSEISPAIAHETARGARCASARR